MKSISSRCKDDGTDRRTDRQADARALNRSCWAFSAGPFVISLFLFVKIDLATDSGSEYDRDKKKIGFHFFLHV